MIQDGRVDIETKNACMVAMVIRIKGDKAGIKRLMQEMEMMTAIRLFSVFQELSQLRERQNVRCYNCNEKGHYARDCQKPRVRNAKYFKEQMLLAMKDKAGSSVNNEENDFMLDTSYGEETMEKLTAAVMFQIKVMILFLKAGLGYKNHERLKKAIAAQQKLYDGELLHCAKLNIDSPDSDETLEDA
nr:hypothetical protein [Tanacetum cinerariifolium]